LRKAGALSRLLSLRKNTAVSARACPRGWGTAALRRYCFPAL
jgi:hypothetical protein